MHNLLEIETTKNKEVVSLTHKIEELVQKSDIQNGLCHIFVAHTTCAVTTADLDPGTDLDMLDAYTGMVPDKNYRHPHDPSHVGDHIMASAIGPQVTIPVQKGRLILGQWQEVVLIEFSGPRLRSVYITVH